MIQKLPNRQQNRGFVLLSTLVVLLVISIIALSTYLQTTNSMKSIGVSRAKVLASSAGLSQLRTLEHEFISVSGYSGTLSTTPSEEEIDELITAFREEGEDGTAAGFTRIDVGNGAVAFYTVEVLDSNDIKEEFGLEEGQKIYRSLIVTFYQSTPDILESAYLIEAD